MENEKDDNSEPTNVMRGMSYTATDVTFNGLNKKIIDALVKVFDNSSVVIIEMEGGVFLKHISKEA